MYNKDSNGFDRGAYFNRCPSELLGRLDTRFDDSARAFRRELVRRKIIPVQKQLKQYAQKQPDDEYQKLRGQREGLHLCLTMGNLSEFEETIQAVETEMKQGPITPNIEKINQARLQVLKDVYQALGKFVIAGEPCGELTTN
ncbi:hypothetical protein KY311_04905 [Candidatus Woesearchaeota archaeon]|nr:hypothetical protein [Candidatus Woesearchaeota archaeon]MBW3017024.1 hypothetical protein [Candidatus Woesearchaeota archaeon]